MRGLFFEEILKEKKSFNSPLFRRPSDFSPDIFRSSSRTRAFKPVLPDNEDKGSDNRPAVQG